MPPSPPKVLVVDPDPSIRTLLVALLRRGGFSADSAADHDAALRCTSSTRYAAVIVEPRMVRGDALLGALSGADGKPHLIIATTPDAASNAYARRDDVRAVLVKPFQIEELYSIVNECCGS